MAARRGRGRRLAIGAAAVAALAAAGVVAYAESGSAPVYRTATVTRGSVSAVLDLVGTVTPVTSASVGFAQNGTVASVDVVVGDQVSAGQVLARLDLTDLQAKLDQAEATEAAARQTLVAAENGQLPASAGPGGNGGSPAARSGAAADTAAISKAQQAVTAAQKAVDTAQATAKDDLTRATGACPSSGAPDPQGCLTAESALLAAQEDLHSEQATLASAQSGLAELLDQTAAAVSSTGQAGAAGSGSSVSAAQLAAYQAALDADVAAVAVAQQNLDQGTAVSPLNGTVVAVGVAPGQSVSAGSSTAVIQISAPEGYRVTTTVATGQIGRVAVGQQASVVPDGTATALAATVTSIAPAPDSSGYPVVLGLTGPTTGLHLGSSATVRLTTGSARQATVVPTSAVHTVGARSFVVVYDHGSVTPTVVTVGTMGADRAEIRSGLRVGERVVLADLSSTVTSDSSTTGGGRFGPGGGFARVGFAGGGTGSGRAPRGSTGGGG